MILKIDDMMPKKDTLTKDEMGTYYARFWDYCALI